MSYHMIKYIHEGPEALQRTLQANESAIQSLVARVRERGLRQVIVTGIGSSYTASVMARPTFRYHCPLPTYVMSAPEVGYYASRLIDESTLVIVVSRSGERGVVVDALRDAIKRGAFGVAVTGVADSLLAQNAQLALVTSEGPEITFPKTKSVIACTGLLMRIALALAAPEDEEGINRLKALYALSTSMARAIAATEPVLRSLVSEIVSHELVALTGTGSNYGAALEGALKIQETASVPTRPDTTDGLINGPVGALTAKWLVVPLVTAFDLELNKELLRLVRGRGAHSLCISEPNLDLAGLADHVLVIPDPVDRFLAALSFLPSLQLLTYYWAVARCMNPDAPTSMRAILDAILPAGREEPELR